MYELVQAGPHTYYIDCPAKMGLWVADGGAYLIDSGGDASAAKKARRHLDANGWTLRGIINTHSHADHIGGNHFLQQQTGCPVFAVGMDAAFTRHPMLEPALLWGGYPSQDLRHKFLLAQESDPRPVEDPAFPKALEVIPLPGHSFDMIGIRTPDNVVFLADCLSSAATLEKYRVAFLWDVAAALRTLEVVEGLEAALFVPAHAEASADVRPLVRLNRSAICAVADDLVELVREPITFETLLTALFDRYGLTLTMEQYALVGSTVRSYLAWLRDSGRVEPVVACNRLLWRAL